MSARLKCAYPQKEKGPTFVGPVVVEINSPANRPDPDDPGGLGAEGIRNRKDRANAVHCYSQSPTASAWRKWGIIVIPLTIP